MLHLLADKAIAHWSAFVPPSLPHQLRFRKSPLVAHALTSCTPAPQAMPCTLVFPTPHLMQYPTLSAAIERAFALREVAHQ